MRVQNYFPLQEQLGIVAFRHLSAVQHIAEVIAEGEAPDPDVVGRLLQGQRRSRKVVDFGDGSFAQQLLRFGRILS